MFFMSSRWKFKSKNTWNGGRNSELGVKTLMFLLYIIELWWYVSVKQALQLVKVTNRQMSSLLFQKLSHMVTPIWSSYSVLIIRVCVCLRVRCRETVSEITSAVNASALVRDVYWSNLSKCRSLSLLTIPSLPCVSYVISLQTRHSAKHPFV